MKRNTTLPFILAASIALIANTFAQTKGPSTGSTPYILPTAPGISTMSVLTVDNTGATVDDTVPKVGGGKEFPNRRDFSPILHNHFRRREDGQAPAHF